MQRRYAGGYRRNIWIRVYVTLAPFVFYDNAPRITGRSNPYWIGLVVSLAYSPLPIYLVQKERKAQLNSHGRGHGFDAHWVYVDRIRMVLSPIYVVVGYKQVNALGYWKEDLF